LLTVAVLVTPLGGDCGGFDRCGSEPTEIFRGVVYGCRLLGATAEGGGSVYWVRVDLKAPGIKLYVTPLDPAAVAAGWQYRLRGIRDVINSEQLAVAVNGTMFDSDPGRWPRWMPGISGDFARSATTVVANHVVAQGSMNTDLLRFDAQLNPHLPASKPPKPADLVEAQWGVGGEAFRRHDREGWWRGDQPPDSRTAVAIDEQRHVLFLAVGEWISPRLLLETLVDLGAEEGVMLDGGSSSAMAIGEGARRVSGGVLLGGWRPVATYFGVKAELLGAAH
jgi:hypothetical protein